ncbi:uncharacterized protein LOC135847549 [Planococcus citri]|uniref:uncharacterized protein LOC135847549 n=1 Tax=Planococcus citri TaxID=170843 RepID=UPI0031F737E4
MMDSCEDLTDDEEYGDLSNDVMIKVEPVEEDGDIEDIDNDADFDPERSVGVPEKSKHRYESMYDGFVKWQEDNGYAGHFIQDVVLKFFTELANSKSPATLWSCYSMLRSMLHLKQNVDISKYTDLKEFIKSRNKDHIPVKAKIFTDEQLLKFINEAPDAVYLATKVVLIFTLMGACKTDELVDMGVNQIETHGRMYLVKIPNPGTNTHRSFTISDQYYDLVEKYWNLRPANLRSDRFFTNYQRGKCTVQFIGKNKFTKMPKQIAEYLHLDEPERYTGHSIRCTTITTYATGGIKRRPGVRNISQRSCKKKTNALIQSCAGFDQLSSENSDSESSSSIKKHKEMQDFVPVDLDLSMDSASMASNQFSTSDQPKQDESRESPSAGDQHIDQSHVDLINKYFTFENCSNIHITFHSRPK